MTVVYSIGKADNNSYVGDSCGRITSTVAPQPTDTPIPGTFWVNTSTNLVYIYTGSGGWWRIGDFGALT